MRSKVEHPFLTLKRLWGFVKGRYRGLAKNANRAFAMLAMINLNKWDRPLTGGGVWHEPDARGFPASMRTISDLYDEKSISFTVSAQF